MIKPKRGQPQTPDEPQGRDLFETPAYAVDLLVPFIPKHIATVWECAAGSGRITRRLEYHKFQVISSDIRGIEPFNFLTSVGEFYEFNYEETAIITNPPFSLKRQFFERCISLSVPFALLLPADYSLWTIDAVRDYKCEKIVPSRRIDYITPNGKSGKASTAQFHSMWLTQGFSIGKSETFVELSLQQKENV